MSQESKTPRTEAAWTSAGVTERNLYRLACDLELELAAVTAERDAFIASARIREANSGWRPIETAPKDGTPVDLWRGEWKERAVNMRRVELRHDNVFYEAIESGPTYVRDATHWMPLPAQPTTEPER